MLSGFHMAVRLAQQALNSMSAVSPFVLTLAQAELELIV